VFIVFSCLGVVSCVFFCVVFFCVSTLAKRLDGKTTTLVISIVFNYKDQIEELFYLFVMVAFYVMYSNTPFPAFHQFHM